MRETVEHVRLMLTSERRHVSVGAVEHGGHGSLPQASGSVAEVLREVLQNAPFLLVVLVAAASAPLGGQWRRVSAVASIGGGAGIVGGSVLGSPPRVAAYVAAFALLTAAVATRRHGPGERQSVRATPHLAVAATASAVAAAGVLKPAHRTDIREWTIVLGLTLVIAVAVALLAGALRPGSHAQVADRHRARPETLLKTTSNSPRMERS